MGTADDLALRCAVHPSLPAADACPVCDRPRCAGDAAAAPGGGCLACQGRRGRAAPPPMDLQGYAGAAVCAWLVGGIGGLIASEYMGTGLIHAMVVFFLGIVIAMAAEYGAGQRRGRNLRILAAGYSVLATAVAFHSPYAVGEPFDLHWRVLGSYVLAAGAAWLWTMPPRPKRKPKPKS